jgi:hypothetical protein
MKQSLVLFAAVALLAGCASNTGVVPMSDDTFRIYQRSATGFVSSEAIEADEMRQADKYCGEQGKSLQVTNVILGNPPYLKLNFPKAEVQFKCVNPKDIRSAASTDDGSTQGATGTMAVESNAAGAEVFVDGKSMGSAPLPSLRLSAGTHIVEVTAKGYLPWKRELTVANDAAMRVVARMERVVNP